MNLAAYYFLKAPIGLNQIKNIGVSVLLLLQVQRKDCEEKLRQYEERAVAAEKAQKSAEEAAKIRYYYG
jgi:hypothetical protein